MTRRPMSRSLLVGLVVLVQMVLVALSVGGQALARISGTEYRLRVAPIDPVDPFRGAYVQLGYPDLRASLDAIAGLSGTSSWVYLPLVQDGDHWIGGTPRSDRGTGPVLRCPRSSSPWDPCGLGSYFLSEDRAKAAETQLGDGSAAVIVRIDDAGRAVLTDFGGGGTDRLTPDDMNPVPADLPTEEPAPATN